MKTDEDLIDALPGDLRRIAEVAGVEAAVKIARAFRGTFHEDGDALFLNSFQLRLHQSNHI